MFQIGDKVVYPAHGAGTIEAIEEREILGSKRLYYVMNIRNMEVMFPMESNIGIREIVGAEIIEDVLSVFDKEVPPTLVSPSQRYRENMNKLKSGDIYDGAQVIHNLTTLGKKRTLATGDKTILDSAKQILISELVLVKGIDEQQAEDLLNDAIDNAIDNAIDTAIDN